MTTYDQILLRLAKIRARSDGATPPPWAVLDDTDDYTGLYVESLSHPQGHQNILLKSRLCDAPQPYADMTFIAHARTDCPMLCEALKEAVEALSAIETMPDYDQDNEHRLRDKGKRALAYLLNQLPE